ncbi:ORF40 [Ranid herpesvirus 1]|uniref:ORF40 n=1 Tax=Ranid herpesvirus 1 TaxID=85655 RepID=Q14VR8_9VIRU|nr:ORF40 [Ranid herpesvirus 1]ABG25783.1 ORF40 [Ranid herpesvirus 1]
MQTIGVQQGDAEHCCSATWRSSYGGAWVLVTGTPGVGKTTSIATTTTPPHHKLVSEGTEELILRECGTRMTPAQCFQFLNTPVGQSMWSQNRYISLISALKEDADSHVVRFFDRTPLCSMVFTVASAYIENGAVDESSDELVRMHISTCASAMVGLLSALPPRPIYLVVVGLKPGASYGALRRRIDQRGGFDMGSYTDERLNIINASFQRWAQLVSEKAPGKHIKVIPYLLGDGEYCDLTTCLPPNIFACAEHTYKA